MSNEEFTRRAGDEDLARRVADSVWLRAFERLAMPMLAFLLIWLFNSQHQRFDSLNTEISNQTRAVVELNQKMERVDTTITQGLERRIVQLETRIDRHQDLISTLSQQLAGASARRDAQGRAPDRQ